LPIKIGNLNSDPPAPRGIALLITLVIIALLAVYMTEFSFDTHLETRGIRNFQASFKARNAVKSLFKATLVGLQGGLNGEVSEKDFFDQISPPSLRMNSLLTPSKPEKIEGIQLLLPGLAQSFPNVSFYTPYIRPIDHLFNLNRINSKIAPEKAKDLILKNEFTNILSRYSKTQSTESNQNLSSANLSLESIQTLYASIYDWSDKNAEIDYFDSNIEGHIQIDDTEWEVKDSAFDKLSEIMLLQSKLFEEGYFEFQIPFDSQKTGENSWNQNFTVYPVGKKEGQPFGDPRINVNLGDGDDIQQFLERFSNPGVNASDKEQQYLNRAADIASVLKPDFSQDAQGFKSMNDIKTRLRSDPSTSDLNDYHNNYFILWSNWYDIHLVTEIENVKAEVRAVVEVKRDENGKVEKNDNGEYAITIHEFQLR
jgi:hypothetical protein|tara:strand:+ start:50 stop:1324 length:1275 start_codon:yes stop_codon:yes gene_type:complete